MKKVKHSGGKLKMIGAAEHTFGGSKKGMGKKAKKAAYKK